MSADLDDLDDLDLRPSRTPWLAAAAMLVVVGGAAGWWFVGRSPTPPPAPPVEQTEVQVIQAGAVVPDTQGPQVAKGADADRTAPTLGSTQSSEPNRRPPAARPSGRTREASDNKGRRDQIKIDETDAPLAGLE